LPYNATLCKEALGKVFVAYYHFVRRDERLAYKNFLERWQAVENEGLKL